jgi:cytochrome oxidase assembly protein ShyY1
VYRFLLRPAWLLSHVLVLALIVVLFDLGMWQLRRLDEKQAANELIGRRADAAAVDIDEITDPSDPVSVGADLLWTTVEVSGSYAPDDQVLLRSRSLNGQPGFWVLTPLVLDDGSAIVVNRGWVPFRDRTDGSDTEIPTGSERVTVVGLVQESVAGPRVAEGENTTIAHVDLEWFDDRAEADLHPVYLQLVSQDPDQPGDVPVTLDAPDLSEGPHFGYAMQWFIFMTIAIVGYPIVLYKVAHSRGSEGRNRPPDYDDQLVSGGDIATDVVSRG